MTIKLLLTPLLLLTLTAAAQVSQTGANGVTGNVTVLHPQIKETPASRALNEAAKEISVISNKLELAGKQSESAFEISQKAVQEQLKKESNDLHDKLVADKKYSEQIKKIDTLSQQLQAGLTTARDNFAKEYSSDQQKVAVDMALVPKMEQVVREENGLPPAATYNKETQTWTVPK